MRYHSKFHVRSTATAIFEETARTYSRTHYKLYNKRIYYGHVARDVIHIKNMFFRCRPYLFKQSKCSNVNVNQSSRHINMDLCKTGQPQAIYHRLLNTHSVY